MEMVKDIAGGQLVRICRGRAETLTTFGQHRSMKNADVRVAVTEFSAYGGRIFEAQRAAERP